MLICTLVAIGGALAERYQQDRVFRAIAASVTGLATGEDMQVLFDSGWLGRPAKRRMLGAVYDELLRRLAWNFRR